MRVPGDLPVYSTTRICYALVVIGATSLLTSCTAVQGYPRDPENTSAVLASLQPALDPSAEEPYFKATDPTTRRQLRDMLVLSRVHAYDIEADEFEKSLFANGNGLSTASDLVVLVLNGVGATTGGAAAKSALAAASAGVVGAQGVVNKDLYYQRTLPALVAQIEANRAKAKLTIFSGLTQEDAKYSLLRADLDLQALKKAGSIPEAISNITQDAANANDAAQAKIDALRVLNKSRSSSTQRILRWLYPPNGEQKDAEGHALPPDKARFQALQQWMTSDTVDPTLKNLLEDSFVEGDSPDLEDDRNRALADQKLNIP
jgi:hypothetical protein